ncbi:HTH domain-containing protein [Halorientalis sp.]|uniref:HTH domain-containing protein n=1 Tax=Halorientalis sp. TaxID=1931229 RepID=UPI002615547D|nr:HTH domain-containing protein [Halorientalis sp.]
MTTEATSERVTVDLHVRSLTPRAGHGRQEVVIERLERLADTGQIHEFSVQLWGRQVSLSTAAARTDAGQNVLDRVEQFRDWAADTDRSISSFFETRRISSEMTEESYVALVLPMFTLAEYHDDDLAYVAPCSDGDGVCTVTDRLDTLEHESVVTKTLEADGDGRPIAEEAEE